MIGSTGVCSIISPAPARWSGSSAWRSFVRTARELTVRRINSEGGCGIRIWPRQLMEATGLPARRGGQAARLRHLDPGQHPAGVRRVRVEHRDLDPLQIVDWKSPGENLNPYDSLARHRKELTRDPFQVLRGRYPTDAAVSRCWRYYSSRLVRRMKMGDYNVIGKREYRGHAPGVEFEARIEPGAERRAVDRGDIVLLRRVLPTS